MNLKPSFPFLRLPAEIRNQIYELCLVVDGTINPYPVHYQDSRVVPEGQSKPSVALLRVSKQIKAEARPIYHGRNTWLHNQNCIRFQQNSASFARQPFWDKLNASRRTLLGHVIIKFSFRDLTQEGLVGLFTDWTQSKRLHKPISNSRATALEIAHDQQIIILYHLWHPKIKQMMKLVGRSHPPKELTLDFTECYCQTGCCRPMTSILDALMLSPRNWAPGQVTDARRAAQMEKLRKININITGLVNEEERESLEKKGFPGKFFLQDSKHQGSR
ncbi:MAG: hypothetical protein LQ337_005045 [Flavoplaca oasis]|nr:MAG: hypothetical protein LQ337_005045 [Flavoplaca oasis]